MTRQTVELASVSHDPASHSHALVCGMWTFPSSESPPCAQTRTSGANKPWRQMFWVFSHLSFPLLRRSFTPCVTHSTPSGSLVASHKTLLLLPPHPSGFSPLSLTVRTWIVRAFIVCALTARQETIRVHTRYVLLPEIKLKIRVNVWLDGIWPWFRWHVSPS